MIMNADPASSDKMWELDCYVESYLKGYEITRWPHKVTWKSWTENPYDREYPEMATVDHPNCASISPRPYSRSRNDLKRIRPEKCQWSIATHREHDQEVGSSAWVMTPWKGLVLRTPILQTEELAELYSIIQAIDHARKKSTH